VQSGGAGTGVLRWRANGDTVSSVASPVLMRTQTGTVPTLPAALDVVYSGGTRGTAQFTWQPITPDMVADTNVEPFVVYGTNAAYGLIAEARIYVRPEMSEGGISIQGAQTFTQQVAVGTQPALPTKVEVSYNDGSRDNQAIGVNWNFDPAVVQTEGRYTITGDLVLPWYVSSAGTVQTTLKLTVGNPPEPGITSVTVSPKTAVVVRGTTKQFTADVVAVGGASAAVTWSVSGAVTGTAVSADGLLTVGTGETATSLTVTATSVADPTKSDSATVTVTAPVATTSVAGRITGASDAAVAGACVYLYPHGVSTAAIAASCGNADGRYVIRSVPSGSYDVAVVDPSGGHPTQWYAGANATAAEQSGATEVVVGSSAVIGLDVKLKAATSGALAGLVTDAISGANLGNICAFVYRADEQASAGYATCTSADGAYWIGSVATGSYQVAFFDPTGAHPTAWFAGAGVAPTGNRSAASAVAVTGGATATVSVALPGATTGVVTGTITDADGSAPLAGVCAYLYPHGQSAAAAYATCTGADGGYWFGAVTAGSYDLAVYDPTGAHPTGWYAGAGQAPASAQSGASALNVAGGGAVTANLAMAGRAGAAVSGSVTATGGGGLANICVFAYQHGQSAAASFATCSVAGGSYELPQVTTGSYDVAFYDPSGSYLTQWWTGTAGGSATQSGAIPVAVATTPVTGVNALMAAVA
jgi:hypothetical protein